MTTMTHDQQIAADRRVAVTVPVRRGGLVSLLTYGLGVSLLKMRDPAAARAHVPVNGPGAPR
jgi:hypothetical protein